MLHCRMVSACDFDGLDACLPKVVFYFVRTVLATAQRMATRVQVPAAAGGAPVFRRPAWRAGGCRTRETAIMGLVEESTFRELTKSGSTIFNSRDMAVFPCPVVACRFTHAPASKVPRWIYKGCLIEARFLVFRGVVERVGLFFAASWNAESRNALVVGSRLWLYCQQ